MFQDPHPLHQNLVPYSVLHQCLDLELLHLHLHHHQFLHHLHLLHHHLHQGYLQQEVCTLWAEIKIFYQAFQLIINALLTFQKYFSYLNEVLALFHTAARG